MPQFQLHPSVVGLRGGSSVELGTGVVVFKGNLYAVVGIVGYRVVVVGLAVDRVVGRVVVVLVVVVLVVVVSICSLVQFMSVL